MKRILFSIVFLIPFLLIKAAFAQLSFQMVPVIDPYAIDNLSKISDTLDSLTGVVTNELQRLNLIIGEILGSQIDQKITNIFTDALKERTYQEYSKMAEEFLKRNEVTEDVLKKEIDEARIRGAILALNELPQEIPCLNPNIREDVLNYTKSLLEKENIELSLFSQEKIFSQIPDCQPRPQPSPLVFKNTNPFNLGKFLAQINSEEDQTIPSVIIYDAMSQTEDSIEAIGINYFIVNSLSLKIKEEEEKTKKELAKYKPIKKCLKYGFTDSGKFICLESKILINLDDLEKMLENRKLANPLEITFQEIYIFGKKISVGQNIFQQIGLTTSTELIFPTSSEIEEVINKVCQKYSRTTKFPGSVTTSSDVFAIAYVKCLEEFKKKLENLAKIEKEKIGNMKNLLIETGEETENLQKEFNRLRNNSIISQCKGIEGDLEEVIRILGVNILNYNEVLSIISKLEGFINGVLKEINDLSRKIDNIFNDMIKAGSDVISILEEILNSDIFGNKKSLNLFGIKIPTRDYSKPRDYSKLFNELNKVLKKLKDIKEEVIAKVNKIIEKINSLIEKEAGIFARLNEFQRKLDEINFSRSTILSDQYQLSEIRKKLEAYQKLIESGGCLLAKTQGQKNLETKKSIIIVESKPKEKNLSWLKKLFGSKLVEIKKINE